MDKALKASLVIGLGVGFIGGSVQGMIAPLVGSIGSWAAPAAAAAILSYAAFKFVVK